ncbi:hypothetical protein HHI36_003943 [Cryptolaemus montrouzieri]|uniref:Reverse transcriptase zinc-binding domain-containing protein n=1 Tax=Cryptolaemus montrouzieri TaxID=559131 RepID=A0ABD2NQR3_9CUCU
MSLHSCQTGRTEQAPFNMGTGHSGIEKADLLTARGTGLGFIGPEFPWRLKGGKYLSDHWMSLLGLRLARLAVSEPSIARAKVWLKLSRLDLRVSNAILTGHCRFRNRLNKLGLIEDPSCRLCEEDTESMEHVMCECLAGDRVRMEELESNKLKLTELIKLSPTKLVSFTRKMELVDEI